MSQNEHSLNEHPSVTWNIRERDSEGGLYNGWSYAGYIMPKIWMTHPYMLHGGRFSPPGRCSFAYNPSPLS